MSSGIIMKHPKVLRMHLRNTLNASRIHSMVIFFQENLSGNSPVDYPVVREGFNWKALK